MKLNPGIIFDNLQANVNAEVFGQVNDTLLLEHPVFYAGDGKTFLSDTLYIAMADRLPQQPVLSKGTVIICVGDGLHLSPYRERCCFIQIKERADFFRIANLVQSIFNTYSRWNERLFEILSSTASVREMLECSRDIFENPLFVINSDFHIIASAGYSEKMLSNPTVSAIAANDLSLPTIAQFLEHRELSLDVKESMLMNLLDTSTLNTNLFNNDEYIGCLTIDYRLRPHRTSDIPLARHLAAIIVQALQKLSAATSNERTVLKRALQDMLDGLPTTPEQNRALESADANRGFTCIKMRLDSRLASLPMDYICTELEHVFPKSIAFEYDASVVGFIEMKSLDDIETLGAGELGEKIFEFIKAMDMRVGVSDRFVGLSDAHLYYRQATAALASGSLIYPEKRYFLFQDIALTEMIINMIDVLPVEMYHSPGLRNLLEHDAEAPISYIETLRVYLDQSMNVSRAAMELYVHRSTLLERITRIERILDTDLKNPDERLRIQVLLKAMQVTDQIRGASGDS